MATEEKAGTTATRGCPHLEGFDPLLPDQVGNPWPWLARARQETPVFYMPEYEMWCITRHDDALAIYRDPITFSNEGSHDMRVPIPASLAGEVPADYKFPFAGQLNTTDPPQHTRIRKLMQKAFTPRHVGEREPQIRELCNQLIDSLVADGRTDFTGNFASPVPITVISGILGIPAEKTGGFREWAEDFFRLSGATSIPEDEAEVRWHRMYQWDQFIRAFVAERREDPQDDLTSALIHAKGDSGDPSLTDDEVLANILGIVAAGADTTTILITHLVYLLLRHRERWEEVLGDRDLIPRAVEETMRLMGPVRGLRRTTTAPVELGGVKLQTGSVLYLHVGSASRDADVFEASDHFDLHRENANKHLGFGIWTHFCIGAPLARLEARVALDTLLDRLPGLRLPDTAVLIDYSDNMVLPSPRKLEVEWDV
ncbi:MAG: cytochrome P450 [Solirubrobacterales bacterium]